MNPRLQTLHWCGRSPEKQWKDMNIMNSAELFVKRHQSGKRLFWENSPVTAEENSPECIRLWAAKSPCCANDRLHVSQAYGFSPVWVRWWICKRNTREKLRPHRVHWWGFSPVCVLKMWNPDSYFLFISFYFEKCFFIYLMWTLRLLLSTKLRSHMSHWYGLRPLCRRACKSSAPCVLNVFGHVSQLNGRSPVCIYQIGKSIRKIWYFALQRFEQKTTHRTRVCVVNSDWVGNARSQYLHLWFLSYTFFRLAGFFGVIASAIGNGALGLGLVLWLFLCSANCISLKQNNATKYSSPDEFNNIDEHLFV